MTYDLGVIERKVLGALLILSDEERNIHATLQKIAEAMGYKTAGGAISFALKILERENYITSYGKGRYKLLV